MNASFVIISLFSFKFQILDIVIEHSKTANMTVRNLNQYQKNITDSHITQHSIG